MPVLRCRLSILNTLGLVLGAVLVSSGVLTANAAQGVRHIVQFTSNAGEIDARSVNAQRNHQTLSEADINIIFELPARSAYSALLKPDQVEALRRRPDVRLVERDPPRYPMAEITPLGISQIGAVNVPYAGDPGIEVCIVDSGYDLGHPDLPGGPRVTGTSTSAGNWFQDGSGHGTHVAGTILALGNDIGVRGVIDEGDFNIHIYRIFDDEGDSVPSSTVVAAVDACVARGAEVINLSLGCSGNDCYSVFERQAFDDAWAAGVLSVAAAGNDGTTQRHYPAAYESVIAVGAIDSANLPADFTQRFTEVELAAPGVSVLSTVPAGTGLNANVSVASTGFDSVPLEGSAFGSASAELVDCGLAGTVCQGVSDKICLIQRGTFLFRDKAENCMDGGGIGAVIYNHSPGIFIGTLGELQAPIPVVGVSDSDGATLLTLLGQNATVSVGTDDYDRKNGTSMATPHVSGAAALIWGHEPTRSNADIRTALRISALDVDAPGRDAATGFGLVQAGAALTALTGDRDGDGVTDTADNCPHTANASQADLDADALGDVCDDDDDNDGMRDTYELDNGLNPRTDDAMADADGDGFSNLAEALANSLASSGASVPDNTPNPLLAASVLPTSRSARVGLPVTAFATLINADPDNTMAACALSPQAPISASYGFVETDPMTNDIIGSLNQPVAIAPGQAGTFLFSLTPNAVFEPTDIVLRFTCEGQGPAPVVRGLNTLNASASSEPVADVVMLASTPTQDGIANLAPTGVFAVAAANVGRADTLTATAHTDAPLPLTLTLCQSDPATAACINPTTPAATTTLAIDAAGTPTFSVFIDSESQIPFDPAINRVQITLRDTGGVVRGSTSVAVRTSP